MDAQVGAAPRDLKFLVQHCRTAALPLSLLPPRGLQKHHRPEEAPGQVVDGVQAEVADQDHHPNELVQGTSGAPETPGS